jgi:hypothetical protein
LGRGKVLDATEAPVRRPSPTFVTLSAALLSAAALYAGLGGGADVTARPTEGLAAAIPLKDAKLNIEHNATDRDTGFQGFVDSERVGVGSTCEDPEVRS